MNVTNLLRDRFAEEQRQEILRRVWRLIGADGAVEEWEVDFADHIARLRPAAEASVRAQWVAAQLRRSRYPNDRSIMGITRESSSIAKRSKSSRQLQALVGPLMP